MNTIDLAKTRQALNLKKLAKPIAICISALFIISMISMLSATSVQAATTTSPLHTSGHLILDANNNPVYLRGIGRAGDIDSLSGIWSGPGDSVYNYGNKWQTDFTVLAQKMDATFACYRDVWKVNMIRVFVPVDWWWDDKINPAQAYGEGPNQVMSYKNYIELIAQEADKYGIYVDFCPYSVLNYYKNQGNWDGIPGSLGTASLAYMQKINQNEITAWRMWWTSVVERLGKYPNVIFEMWNEPDNDKQAYYNYMINAYQAIRATGNTNLIFMQYYLGLVPGYNELTWVPEFHNQLKNALGKEPLNVAYTTHPYRRAPYPNLVWSTTCQGVKQQLSAATMIPATRSNGIDVPLVFNEMGVMLEPSMYSNDYFPDAQKPESTLTVEQKMQNELAFWDAILRNAYEMDVGVCSYYWMQTGVWWGSEALISQANWPANAASPTPSQTGQIFINNYVAKTPVNPTPTTTPSPTPNPTPVPIPTPVQTPTPTATPTPEPTPTPTPQPTPTPSSTPIPTPTPTPTSTAPTQSPAETPTPQPTQQANVTPTSTEKPTAQSQESSPKPTQTPTEPPNSSAEPIPTFRIQPTYRNHWSAWYLFKWGRFNAWFFYFR
ncbi:MAG: cellulase family glycosylhydrolase [Candidatus Bathyarchaeota archaeon]|nr:cellulase family glycosylhydrolase [Candidatus Bathyarchaeota archaeon]